MRRGIAFLQAEGVDIYIIKVLIININLNMKNTGKAYTQQETLGKEGGGYLQGKDPYNSGSLPASAMSFSQ